MSQSLLVFVFCNLCIFCLLKRNFWSADKHIVSDVLTFSKNTCDGGSKEPVQWNNFDREVFCFSFFVILFFDSAEALLTNHAA